MFLLVLQFQKISCLFVYLFVDPGTQIRCDILEPDLSQIFGQTDDQDGGLVGVGDGPGRRELDLTRRGHLVSESSTWPLPYKTSIKTEVSTKMTFYLTV